MTLDEATLAAQPRVHTTSLRRFVHYPRLSVEYVAIRASGRVWGGGAILRE